MLEQGLVSTSVPVKGNLNANAYTDVLYTFVFLHLCGKICFLKDRHGCDGRVSTYFCR